MVMLKPIRLCYTKTRTLVLCVEEFTMGMLKTHTLIFNHALIYIWRLVYHAKIHMATKNKN